MRSAPIGKFVRRGKRLEITGLTNKRVRFLVQKFLHTNHLFEYNFPARADTFEIIRIRPETKSKEDERPKHPVPFRAHTTSTHRGPAQTGHRVTRNTSYEEHTQQELTSEHAWRSAQNPK